MSSFVALIIHLYCKAKFLKENDIYMQSHSTRIGCQLMKVSMVLSKPVEGEQGVGQIT